MGVILGIITGASLLASALVAVWMVGAIFHDLCLGAKWGRYVALAWAAGVIAILVVWRPLWQPIVALLGAESRFLAWWYGQKPSNDRDWDPSMAVLPRAAIAEDAVTIEIVRNLEYRPIDDFKPQFEVRIYHLWRMKYCENQSGYLYRLNSNVEELRRLAYLNDIANSAPATGFGDHIRRELERRRHER